jgi:hypothetical protein
MFVSAPGEGRLEGRSGIRRVVEPDAPGRTPAVNIRRLLATVLVAFACSPGCSEPAATPPAAPADAGPAVAAESRVGKRPRASKEPLGAGTPRPGTAPSLRIRDDL